MKTYVLFAVFHLLLIDGTSGEIINGYGKEIQTARASLKNLSALTQNRDVKTRIERARQFILYHELTERLLEQFRDIAPTLYNEIDSLRDYKGRLVNVYVKFVPKSEIQRGALATTNIEQLASDKHTYCSNYGPNTISIRVSTVKHSLSILAHEFGHVRYQVPNLASYVDFFLRHYHDSQARANYLGHKPNDPSGQSAIAFEKAFQKEHSRYIDSSKDKPQNPILILDEIAANLILQPITVYTNLFTAAID